MPTKSKNIIKAARLRQLQTLVPELFGPGSLLYVGASIRRAQFMPELIAAGRQVTILEAYEPNAAHYRQKFGQDRVIHGDIRDLCKLTAERYSVIFWWHGPEHVTREDLPAILATIESRADLVVLGCPWGAYPQKDVGRNRYEKHLSELIPEDFWGWGYETSQLGKLNVPNSSNIVPVKRWIS